VGAPQARSASAPSALSHKRLRSLHSRRLLQNGVPTPVSSRSVNSASRRRPKRPLRRTRRFASVCGGDALGDRHLGPVPQPPAVIRFGIRSPLHQHPLLADAPPLAVERAPGSRACHPPPASKGTCSRRLRDGGKACSSQKKNGFRREGAEAERACGAARLRPDWLPYDRARELKHRSTVAGLMPRDCLLIHSVRRGVWGALIIGGFRQTRFFLLSAAAPAAAQCSGRRRQTF